MRRHRRQVELIQKAEEAKDQQDPRWEDYATKANRLPMYHGKAVTPEGEEISIAIYVNTVEDEEETQVSLSIRPWVEKDQPLPKG